MEPLSRNELRILRGLTSRPVRKRRGVFLLEGARAVGTVLQSGADVRLVVVAGEPDDHPAYGAALELAEELGVEVRSADRSAVAELTDTKTPSGIVASVAWEPLRGPGPEEVAQWLEARAATRLLALDAVADPGNVGSLIRSADAFGLDGILLGAGSVESTNPKVVRGSVGSLLNLPFVAEEVSLPPVLQLLHDRGWTVYRAEVHEGRDYRAALPPTGKWILVLGSEGHGVSEEVGELGEAIQVEMTGPAESLNVAVAGGILLHGLTANWTPHD